MRSVRSTRLALVFAWGASGCSLLAPSRDELSGGTMGAHDAELPVDGSSARDEGVVDEPSSGSDTTDGSLNPDAGDAASDVPVSVLDCSSLKGVGVWESITPPDVSLACPPNGANCGGYGVQAVVSDPLSPGTVYLGTRAQGIWKSTNCGTTWSLLNTGTNSIGISLGTQSILEVDPVDPRIMLTLGSNQNGFRTTNGGVDWEKFWPPSDMTLANVVQDNQVEQVAIDPADHRHVLATFRGKCAGPYTPVCLGESKDSGATFGLINGKPEWRSTGGGHIWMIDANVWLYSNPLEGLWRSPDKGSSWLQLADGPSLGGEASGRLLRAADGSFYLGSRSGILISRDGMVWTINPNVQRVMSGLVSDGALLYATAPGFCFDFGTDLKVYFTSPAGDGKTWSEMTAPPMTQGGVDLAYDGQHHVLYSSNCQQGFWRVVTR